MIGYVRYSPRVTVARRKSREPKGTGGDSPVNSIENQKDQVQRWLKSHGRDPLGDSDWIIDELTSARTTPLRDPHDASPERDAFPSRAPGPLCRVTVYNGKAGTFRPRHIHPAQG